MNTHTDFLAEPIREFTVYQWLLTDAAGNQVEVWDETATLAKRLAEARGFKATKVDPVIFDGD